MDPNIDKIITTDVFDKIPSQILEPFDYLVQIPGNNKGIRSKLLNAFNDLYYDIPNDELILQIEEIISIFHNSSLLIDDIEDSSDYRRGQLAAHIKFGTPLTINCGNLMYFVAFQKAESDLVDLYLKIKGSYNKEETNEIRSDVMKILSDELLNLHYGQGQDIFWRDHLIHTDLPTIEEYLEMVKNKTGGLFRLSVKLLQRFSPKPHNTQILPITNLLGIIFQIRDDYLNLVDDRYSHMKGHAGEDLIEGKLSLPILHCLLTEKYSPVHKLLYSITTSNERKNEEKLIDEAIEFMKNESHSLEFTFSLIKAYQHKAEAMIKKFEPKDKYLIQILSTLCNI